jgi:hypothetical protein
MVNQELEQDQVNLVNQVPQAVQVLRELEQV